MDKETKEILNSICVALMGILEELKDLKKTIEDGITTYEGGKLE